MGTVKCEKKLQILIKPADILPVCFSKKAGKQIR